MLSAATPVQARLSGLLAERVAWVGGQTPAEPVGGPGEGDGPPATRADVGEAAGTVVLVLLRALSLVGVVNGARAFAAGLDAEEALAWRWSWTRTRFLFGNPANLAAPNRPRVVAADGSAAWLGPFPHTRRPGLGRLLKPVTGTLTGLAADVEIAGTGPRRDLWVAVEGLTLAGYLVHLHHTLAEAVLLGRLRPGEALRLRHRPVLDPDLDPGLDPVFVGPPAYARVLPEAGDPGRLRPHTWLSA